MHVRKRIFTFLFAALVMVLLTACGKWDYSREAVKAANEAQGDTLRVEFKVNQTFTNALRAAAEDNIQPNNVDKAMTMDKSIAKLLTSGYRLDVYALRADIDADKAAAQLADEFVNRLAGCEDEGFISMVKADNSYFYMAVLTYKHDSGNGGSGSGESDDDGSSDDGNNDGGSSAQWVTYKDGTLTIKKGAVQYIGTDLGEAIDEVIDMEPMERPDEDKIETALIECGDLQKGESFSFMTVTNLVIEPGSGIKEIGRGAFLFSSLLKKAELNGVEKIADMAFYGCSVLETVTMSASDTTIGDMAFLGCTALCTIDLSHVVSIGSMAFLEASSITEVTLSEKIKSLPLQAFAGCCKLVTVNLSNVETIEDGAFSACSSLEHIDLSKVETIGVGAFGSCESLQNINLSNVENLSGSAFKGSGITTLDLSDLDINITGEISFSSCKNLTTVTLPESLTEIYDSMFSGCESLTTINGIEWNKIETIGSSAFKDCTNLQNIDLPAAETIGESAFSGCTGLSSVKLSVAETIGGSAFSGCTGLSSVKLSVAETIGSHAFSGCTGLSSVELPVAETIGDYAFNGCTSLSRIYLPAAETIEYDAFQGCTALEAIDLSSVTEIGDSAFKNCVKLAHVNLGNRGNPSFYAGIYIYDTAFINAGTEAEHSKTTFYAGNDQTEANDIDWKLGFSEASDYNGFHTKDRFCFKPITDLPSEFFGSDLSKLTAWF